MLAAHNLLMTWKAAAPAATPVAALTGANSGSGTSIALPTHNIGDDIYLFIYRDGSNAVPSKPTASGTVPAWNDIESGNGANTNSCRLAHFVATATNHTSGTWTNATGMIAAVVSNSAGFQFEAQSGATSTTSAVAPTIETMFARPGIALCLTFLGHRSLTAWGTSPTGYTLQTSSTTGGVALLSDNDPSSVGIVTMPCTSSVGGYRGIQIEILPAIPNPTVGSTEVCVARSSVLVPAGLSTGVYVTLIGAGGAGGAGGASGFSGAGGGGGGRIDRVLIPAASLGSTITVVPGVGATISAANGTASTVTTGSISLSAGGGIGGQSNANPSTGGAGGTCSATGVTATTHSGTGGGSTVTSGSGNGTPGGTDTTNNVGCGGGAAGYTTASLGGDGGSSNTVTGGAAGSSGTPAGNPPVDASAGNGGAGGGGAYNVAGWSSAGQPGGNGGAFGGGGGGGVQGSSASIGGMGGQGYTKLEFV